MSIAELQQALHTVAQRGGIDSFQTKILDRTSTKINSAVNASIISTRENGLQLTLF